MAYDGFLRYGGTEVVNLERLAAYLDNGLAPLGARIDVEGCDGLSEVIYSPGWVPYRTPIQDEPPWYDVEDPDTWDFAGVLPLEVTGLDATTRTVDFTQTLRGDGLPGRVQRSPQTIGVTALLVGRTTESVQAGLSWLRRVLHGACDADEQPCGPSGTLEAFTVCPGPLSDVPDLTAPLTVTLMHPNDESAPPGAWYVTNGTFDVEDDDATMVIPYDVSDVVDAEDASPDFTIDVYDGGGAEDTPSLLDGGNADFGEQAIIGGLQQSCTPASVTITWSLRGVDETATVELVILDDANIPVEHGPKYDVDTDDLHDYTWELPFGVDLDTWRPGLVVTHRIDVESVTIDGFAMFSPADCIAPYRRFLPVTSTTSGPTPVEDIDAGCAVLMKVEWVWVSGNPFRYGVTEPMVLGLGWGEEPTFDAPGVTWDEEGGAPISATPWDCSPPSPVAGCAIDPAAPPFGTAPSMPVIVDTTRPRITTQSIRDVWANIGPEQVPTNEGVLTIDLGAGAEPVVGIRVRVWDDANADGTVPSNCEFAYEYLIDYVPENGVLTIDGTSNQITTLCAGNAVPQDASAGVRGDFGGPVKSPVVRCDRRYLVRIQWLDVYPRTAPGYYTSGDPNGDLSVNVYITPREG